MNAMVLCAGLGIRLRPLTDSVPKPLIRLPGSILLHDILCHLASQGVDRAVVNGSWMAGRIEEFLQSDALPLKTIFQHEEEPLGTAGAVRKALPLLGDQFLVVYGDNLTRQPVDPLLRIHRTLQSEVTISLSPTGEPSSKGIVLTGPDGRITEFREKPPEELATTNLSNSGIYVCDSSAVADIKEGDISDFGKDVFPRMLAEGRRLGAEMPGGYTRDIGTLESYLIACHDVLSGRLSLPGGCDIPQDGVLIENHQSLEGITVSGTLWIENGASVMRGCTLADSVVLSGAVVESGSILRNALVLPGSIVKEGTDASDKYLSIL